MTDNKPTKQKLRITNVAEAGFAFALNEDDGNDVFLSRQLCEASEVSRQDVNQYITCMVGKGAKGLQAMTLDFVEQDSSEVVELRQLIDALQKRIADLETIVYS